MNKKSFEKYQRLLAQLDSFDQLAVAFSGGVDSSLLVYAAKEALGDNNMKAITINTAYIPRWELKEAQEFTKRYKIPHEIVHLGISNDLLMNPENRCYLCKKRLFTELKKHAAEVGFQHIAEGSNLDDEKDYRPGTKALQELQVYSPLKDSGLDKKSIREISGELGLPTADKPAYACLLTRIPYNAEIKSDDFKRIEKAELYMFSKGIKACRVRIHDNLARIEVNKGQLEAVFTLREEISKQFRKIGFEHVTLDLDGYRMGSFNETIKKKK